MKIYVGCDHAGLELKNQVMAAYQDVTWEDLGTYTADSIDYPDFANKVCEAITAQEIKNHQNNISDSLAGEVLGLLICGSGQGMAIRANRYPRVRAVLCWNDEITQLSREHNNANVLCLGARFLSPSEAVQMVKTFIRTPFAGGRHQRRVDKLSSDTGC